MLDISIPVIDATLPDFSQKIQRLRDQLSPSGDVVSDRGKALTVKVFGEPLSPEQVVKKVCEDIRTRGADALQFYCRELDGADVLPSQLRVPSDGIEKAHRNAAPEFLESVRAIRENVLAFQSAILHRDVIVEPQTGVRLEQRYVPLERIGICIPGGAAAYPSSVLMTALPAQAAGVNEIALVSPPTKFGAFNDDVLAVCHELGIHEVYSVGGAQGVASLAYGVEQIQSVDKIVGPGNLFVALAKRHVYGHVDIDSIAGPSEVVVIADETTNTDFAASDLLAQAEHSPGASILLAWDRNVLERIQSSVIRQVKKLDRAELTVASLNSFGALVLVRDEDHACDITNAIAPEHLHICVDEPRRFMARIRNSGATFLGQYSPVAVGDYAAGPSHVLPTGGTARWASGLSSNHFLRSSSVIEYSSEALGRISQHVARVADKEGLTAHRDSVLIRTGTVS